MQCIYGITIVILSFVTLIESTPFNKCSGIPAPTTLVIDGCDKFPCVLKRGKNATAEWSFRLTEDTRSLKVKVLAQIIGPLKIPFPLPQPNACYGLQNATCPLKAGQEVTYKLELPVRRYYPQIQLNIIFSFLDDRSNEQLCFEVLARVR